MTLTILTVMWLFDTGVAKPADWHTFVTWPEGITVWAVILMLAAIAWQIRDNGGYCLSLNLFGVATPSFGADTRCMAKRPRDLNQLAKLVVDIASGGVVDDMSYKKRNATAPGRNGGLKGGKARAKALTPAERADIARIAANARWKKT